MERIAKETYEGKLKKGALDTAYILKTYDELESATQKGYGASFAKIDKTTGLPAQNVVAMQQNIFRFSGAKNATMLAQINELLSKDGKRPSFADFKREVLKLNPTYNQNYLQAEFQTALQAGKLASQWGEYERNKKLFPNLKYKSQEDDRVREEHERLNGIIKPVDDPFWNSYYPPNGWRCRCYVVQTAEDSTEEKDMPKIEEKDVKLEFRNNVGKSGQVFKEGTENGGKPHPYFALVKEKGLEKKIDRHIYKSLEYNTKKRLVGKTIKHKEIGDIKFTSKGIKEGFNQPHENFFDKNWTLQYLDTIIPVSNYIGFVDYFKKNPMIKGFHVFEIKINNKESYVLVREMKNGDKSFYSISDSNRFKDFSKK